MENSHDASGHIAASLPSNPGWNSEPSQADAEEAAWWAHTHECECKDTLQWSIRGCITGNITPGADLSVHVGMEG